MTSITWLKSLGILLLFAVNLAGCSDDPPSVTPPDEEEKERFPCTGKWCFDEELPHIKELLDKSYGALDDIVVDTYAEVYASCSYTEDDKGMVTVDCPQWAKDSLMYQCPQNWFSFLSIFGVVRTTDGEDGLMYCFPETDRKKALAAEIFCVDGYVKPGYAASKFSDIIAGNASGASCIKPEDCATLEELRWPSKENSCFYSDFSHISEGAPEEVDCDSLELGECSINCQCPELPQKIVGMQPFCHHLSPSRSVGVCGHRPCREDRSCSIEGVLESQCLHRINLPDWAEDYKKGLAEISKSERLWGTCVQTEHYENWRGKDDALFEYGDTD